MESPQHAGFSLEEPDDDLLSAPEAIVRWKRQMVTTDLADYLLKVLDDSHTEPENRPYSYVVYSIAVLIFGSMTVFAIYNVVKFYSHRSYALGLFYFLTILNLFIRTGYFAASFLNTENYLNVIFLCSPASMSLSIGLCQVMNYVVLYIRLDSYE